MKLISNILVPLALTAALGVSAAVRGPWARPGAPSETSVADTVIYPRDAYKLRRNLQLSEISVVDTSSAGGEFADSLEAAPLPTALSPRDSLKALLDTALWSKIDSIYLADSTRRAKEKFDAWYNSLPPKERKAYDREKKAERKLAVRDSLDKIKESEKAVRDSIFEAKPRILETYALPDSMKYKRIISWKVDQDFHNLDISIPDTSYNYWFNDYPFLRKDVNASWLGVAGSAVQYYDARLRKSEEGVEFYNAQEAWSISPRTAKQYNSKTPYTELAYFGTLLAGDLKESDNLHIFTTQNILPELNFSILFDRFGGKGILAHEETANKTFAVQTNYLGKKYSAHAGYIRNAINRDENGGVRDNKMVSDTTLDAREIAVNLASASSRVVKNSYYLDHQLRIPFDFINRIKAKRDTSFKYNPDSLNLDITTAYLGHSFEFTNYSRVYKDQISDDYGRAFYRNQFFHDPNKSNDSLGVSKLDNKIFLRLQPWSSQAIVSRLDIGVGDINKSYFDSTSVRPTRHNENSFYIYGGAQGQLRNNFYWDAKARFTLLGAEAGDLGIEANARLQLFPFRRARTSPLTFKAHFETTLQEPNYYQKRMNANHFRWDNEFSKISTTEASAELDIPRWRLNLKAGYTLLANNIYYDYEGIIRQNSQAMSLISASLRKEFVLGPLHLDNRVLFQYSSNQSVVPVPTLALNLRYFIEFVVQRDELRRNVMVMQIGANGFYNTKWHSPAWNPNLGVFYNQTENLYNNGPYLDLFVNVQWKRACIFIKYQNFGNGWPMQKRDYFSADHYLVTQSGMQGLKLGIYWPFYTQPAGR